MQQKTPIETAPSSQQTSNIDANSARLGQLSRFSGTPEHFWPLYLEAVCQAFASRRGVLMAQGEQRPWQALLQFPHQVQFAQEDARTLIDLAERALTDSPLVGHLAGGGSLLAMRLPVSPDRLAPGAVLCVWLGIPAPTGPVLLALAELAAGVPGQYQQNRQNADPRAEQSGAHRLYDIIRLGIQLGQEAHFMRMAFALCNELAVRFGAERVVLGWLIGGYVELVAISHIEKFDRKTTAARELVQALEEAYDQDTLVSYPQAATDRSIVRAHEEYVRKQGVGSLMSLPIRHDGSIVALIGVERRTGVLNEAERFELELITEMTARPLLDLRRRERGFRDRIRDGIDTLKTQWQSPTHTGWKLAGISLVVLIVVLSFLPWPYRIDAGVNLKSHDLLFMPAPFDGYLQRVHVEVGDEVAAGQVLVELDTRDLLQEESMALADVARYSREAEKSQATHQLADMQIALARKQQSEARLNLVHHQLQQAQVRAPYAGIVVEGELRKNLGSPLRKGDLLLKLAETRNIDLELEINQVDVHEVESGMKGEMALVGHPEQHFDLAIDTVDPVATQREGQNVFPARATLLGKEPVGWRPGMGGNAKIEVGDRKLIWIATHRTIRFLREFFWL